MVGEEIGVGLGLAIDSICPKSEENFLKLGNSESYTIP